MLSVWLPLNGNIQNQGLINGTTEKGTYISFTNGKIGQCATSSSSNNTIRLTSTEFPSMFANGNAYTLTCWVKVTGNADTGWVVKIGSNTCGLWWAKSAARLVWNENDNGKRIASSPIADDYTNWHHIASVIDKTISGNITARHYIDGVLSTENGTTTWDCSSHSQPAGNYIDIYPYNALINDVRIYDHALSPREVAELAKGLVLHYPLSIPGNENILAGNYSCITTATSHTTSGVATTQGINNLFVANQGKKLWFSFDYSTEGERQAGSGSLGNRYGAHLSFRYTKTDGTLSSQIYPCASYLTMSGTGRAEMSYTLPTDIQSVNNFAISLQPNARPASGNTATWYLKNFKLEIGERATPWVPNEVDSEYSAMGFDDGIEYDVSGYERNGVKTNITYSSDTTRYNTSSVFNGTSSKITTFKPDFIKDEVTFSFWAYMDNWGNGALHSPVSAVQGGGFGMQGNNTQFNIQVGTGTSSVTWTAYTALGSTLSTGWHHFVGTYDGLVFKAYIDGAEVYTKTIYTTKTPIFYNADANSGWLFIGGESGSSATTPDNYFAGKISDVRIYATALSSSNVLELYHTPETLSHNGTLFTQGEFVES